MTLLGARGTVTDALLVYRANDDRIVRRRTRIPVGELSRELFGVILDDAPLFADRGATLGDHSARVSAALAVVMLLSAASLAALDDLRDARIAVDARLAQDDAKLEAARVQIVREAADLAATRTEAATQAAAAADARKLLARLSAPPPRTGAELVSFAAGAIVGVRAYNGGLGTGFAISYDSALTGTFVVTATHVIGSNRTVSVVLPDGSAPGTVVATSRADVAVVWVPGQLLPLLYPRAVSRSDGAVLLRDRLGRTEEGRVVKTAGSVLEVAVPDRGPGYYPGFSGAPIIGATDGQVVGVVISGNSGSQLEAVPFSATCDVLPFGSRVGCP